MTKMYMRGGVYYGTAEDMIDRIEALEAKLAKALEALEWAEFHLDDVNVTSCTVSTAIAELKGATND